MIWTVITMRICPPVCVYEITVPSLCLLRVYLSLLLFLVLSGINSLLLVFRLPVLPMDQCSVLKEFPFHLNKSS